MLTKLHQILWVRQDIKVVKETTRLDLHRVGLSSPSLLGYLLNEHALQPCLWHHDPHYIASNFNSITSFYLLLAATNIRNCLTHPAPSSVVALPPDGARVLKSDVLYTRWKRERRGAAGAWQQRSRQNTKSSNKIHNFLLSMVEK